MSLKDQEQFRVANHIDVAIGQVNAERPKRPLLPVFDYLLSIHHALNSSNPVEENLSSPIIDSSCGLINLRSQEAANEVVSLLLEGR